jgi:hypothetical protein
MGAKLQTKVLTWCGTVLVVLALAFALAARSTSSGKATDLAQSLLLGALITGMLGMCFLGGGLAMFLVQKRSRS